MIIVEIHRDVSGRIDAISASDHSGYKDSGSDIICAGVSTLMYTAIGAIEELCHLTDFYRIVEGEQDVIPFSQIVLPDDSLPPTVSAIAQTILQTIEIGLLQLEEAVSRDYGNQFIRITHKNDILGE